MMYSRISPEINPHLGYTSSDHTILQLFRPKILEVTSQVVYWMKS